MVDVLFVVPYAPNMYHNLPFGSLMLATILKNNGISAELFLLSRQEDFSDLRAFIDAMVREIVQKEAKIVSFYTRCDVYHIDLLIAEQIKLRTAATVVFGGPQSDVIASETLRAFPYVDYICRGEGEATVFPFFSSLLQGKPDLTVDGLAFRDGSAVVQNPRPAFIQNLDELPDVDFSLVGITGDCSFVKRFMVDVGRGCPFSCTYCSTNSFWGRKYRLKSPERIIHEISALHEKHGISSFAFAHDMFTLDRKQVIKICRMMKELAFPIEWSCSARLDCIDPELIDIMVDAGLVDIYLGIETGSPRMQKLIHKNLKLGSALELLQYLHSKSIHVTTSFIHGFPEETPEDLSETLAMIAEILKIDNISVQNHLCAFFPGTEMFTRYADQLVFSSFFSDQTGHSDIEDCKDLIVSHPEVFPQYLEYHTELRKELEYFPLFVRVWSALQPVYQRCAEQYPKERLIDMYFDFAKANRGLFEEALSLPYQKQVPAFLEKDRFPQTVLPEELHPTVQACARMAALAHQFGPLVSGEITEVYPFSPREFQRGSNITQYRKKLTVVQYKKTPGCRTAITVKSAF